jgi:hypothetical protein
VERVLADIDADHGDRGIGCLRHGVLLVFGAPCQLRLLAGQEHGRTIPLSDNKRRRNCLVKKYLAMPVVGQSVHTCHAQIARRANLPQAARLSIPPNQRQIPAVPPRSRGALRDRHER